MIEQLRIRNLGVIAEAELTFARGFTALTGETGAGKTMVFRGLNVLFGTKPDAALVADGADTAAVMAELAITDDVALRLAELGADIDEGIVIVARQVPREGRVRSVIGGASVPNQTLGDLGDELIAIHGQSDHIKLRKTVHQRFILDRFGGQEVAQALTAYQQMWDEYQSTLRLIDELSSNSADREREWERLSYILGRFDELQPQPQEDVLLDAEAKRLSFSESLFTAAHSSGEFLTGGDSDAEYASAIIARARKVLEQAQSLDDNLAPIVQRVRELEILIQDISGDLSHYAAGIDASPQRLAFIEQRRSDFKQLTREFGSVDNLIEWVDQQRPRLDLLQGGEEQLAELRQSLALQKLELERMSAGLTKMRLANAQKFTQSVQQELDGLAMSGSSVTFVIQPDALGPYGADAIELGLISRPNAPWVPLSKGASGGELSRIMLAVQVVLAQVDPVDTFIFDEVDAGVGGSTAIEVGRRLAQLARTSQVIVVTHLPQVAAFADKHYVVQAPERGSLSMSSVTEVAGEQRVTEIARMLAGLSESQAGNDLAVELLRLAEAEK